MRHINLKPYKQRRRWQLFKEAARECAMACVDGASSKISMLNTVTISAVQYLGSNPHQVPVLTFATAVGVNLVAAAILTHWKKAQQEAINRNAAEGRRLAPVMRALQIRGFPLDETPETRLDYYRAAYPTAAGVGHLLPGAIGVGVSLLAKMVL